MRSNYYFELAGKADDHALRSVLRRTIMPGKPSLCAQREPEFFVGEQVGNIDSQVIVARKSDDQSIAGLASRSFRKMFIDGEVKTRGYLSGLRGLPEVRGGTLLARGYRFLRELHADGRTPYYVSTIFDDNDYAKEVLTSGRAGLPVYCSWGCLNTYLLPLYGRHRPRPRCGKVVVGTSGGPLCSLVDCINQFNRRHQFAPWYTQEDFLGATTLLPGFPLENLYGYQDDGNITATLGVWDQSAFKQLVITGYPWHYQVARPFLYGGSVLGLTHRLPRAGQPIPCLYGAFLSHAPQRLAHLESLLVAILRDWSRRGYIYLMVGIHERSAANQVLKRHAVKQKSSRVYLVYWEDALDSPLPSGELVPHLEIGTL